MYHQSSKSDNLDRASYQPISTTPNFAKISECLLLTQMTVFIDKLKNINKEQFRLRKKTLATDAVLDLEAVSSNLDQSRNLLLFF